MTGSEDWKTFAESDKQAGVDAMKAASANRDPQQSGMGKVSYRVLESIGKRLM